MLDITVKVPRNRIAEFYLMHGRWLAGPDEGFGESGLEQDWTSADADLARVVWAKFSPTAKALFSRLIDQPGHRFSGEELAEALRLDKGKHGIAGVLAWPRRHCIAVGRRHCWRWEYPDGETVRYWMDDEMIAAFGQARASE